MALAPVNITTVNFQGSDTNASSLRRLAQDLQTVERALNNLISLQNTASVDPSDTVPPHVLATTSGLDVDHTVTGLTAGQVLKAISAVNAAFEKLKFSELQLSDISDNPSNGQILQFVDGYWTNVNASEVEGITGAVNVGSGIGKVFLSISGTTMQFRSIQGVGITVTEDADTITLTLPGDALQGPPGPQSPPGKRGSRGNRGSYGARGEKGDKGDKGDRGPRGRDGRRGDRGVPGVAGSASTGGGSLTLTDGTNTVAGVTQITVTSGGVVGGTTPNATLAISGGGSANITADTHPATELSVNDEFEFGSTIDLTGARFAGAHGWTAFGITGLSNAVAQGSLILTNASSAALLAGYSQPVAGATWSYTAKVSGGSVSSAGTFSGGLFVNVTGATSGKSCIFVITSVTAAGLAVQRLTNSTTLSASPFVLNETPMQNATSMVPFYLQIGYDGTNLNYGISATGIPGSFVTVFSELPATFLGGVPTIVGFTLGANTNSKLVLDWFRKTL